MPDDIAVADVVARVAQSRRYRSVGDAIVTRLALEEIPHSRNLSDAEKRTKRRLHQIFGAYTGTSSQPQYARLLLDIVAARARGEDALREACRAVMAQHASTRERLPILDEFYARIFAITGTPTTLVDVACGLNPLAVPWMHLPDNARYIACDIDRGMLDLVAGVLDILGVQHQVELRDVITDPPDTVCDVALLLKSVPCLDQQSPEASERLVQLLYRTARFVVISFPTQSLGGRGKGMARNYRMRAMTLVEVLEPPPTVVEELEFPGELVVVVGCRKPEGEEHGVRDTGALRSEGR